MSTASDMAALRDRDPGFRCAYCFTLLALPLGQLGPNPDDWERDGWELYLMPDGEGVWQRPDGAVPAHRDHVEPASKGGADDLDNLVLACEVCNMAKKARPLIIFLAKRAGLPQFRSVGGTDPLVFARAWAA